MATDPKVSVFLKLVDQFSGPLRRMRGQLQGLKSSMESVRGTFQLAGDLSHAADNMDRLARSIRGAVERPIQEFGDFEEAMNSVAAKSGEVGTEGFERMREQALELGSTTSFTAQQAAEAMSNYATAGLQANEIIAATPGTLALARAAGSDLGRSAEIVGSSLRSMRLEATDTDRVTDVLTATFTSSSTTLESLGESFKVVGPIAASTGTNIESLSAMVAVLGNNGIRGSEAGTALRAMFARLVNPAGEAEGALREVGIGGERLVELQAKLGRGDMAGVLEDIAGATEGLADEDRLRILSQLFGQEAVSAASILVREAGGPTNGVTDFIRQLEESEGAAQRTADVMGRGMTGELTRLSSAFSGLMIQIGEKLKPTVIDLASQLQGVIGDVGGWVEENGELVAVLGRLAIITAAALTVVALFTRTMSVLVTIFGGARTALLALRRAYIVTKGVTIALSRTMYTALIPSFVKTRIAALASSRAMMFLRGSMLGRLGLVGLALAAGVAVGRWADETFHLQEKLERLFDWFRTTVLGLESVLDVERAEERGLGDVQEFADGTRIDSSTGEVLELGEGPASAAPTVVREAREAGASTLEEINAFIRENRPAPEESADTDGGATEPASSAEERRGEPSSEDATTGDRERGRPGRETGAEAGDPSQAQVEEALRQARSTEGGENTEQLLTQLSEQTAAIQGGASREDVQSLTRAVRELTRTIASRRGNTGAAVQGGI